VERRLTQRGKQRRNELLTCAVRLFSEQGFHSTSVSDIVDTLGVGKGVFYWYFPSKDDLFIEILRSANRDLRRRQQAAIGGEPDPIRRIELGIRATMQWFHEHRSSFTLIQFARTDDRFSEVLSQNQAVAIADAVRHIKDGIVDGVITDQVPDVLAEAVVGVTERLARTYLLERDDPVTDVADAAVDFCLNGLSR
jgi:Transcriptional regulator